MYIAERFERFDARAVTWFLRAFGLAMVVDVGLELASGVWSVHTGALYPWRHLEIVPLYPAWCLAIEWGVRAAAGAVLVARAHDGRAVAIAVKVAALVLLVAVLERYSNHGVLLLLVAFFLTIAPPDVRAPSFGDVPHPALGLVRAQLVIVYVFSGLNKLLHGFASGASLTVLAARGGHPVPLDVARGLSILVVVVELGLPLVLLWRPRLGIAGVVVVHGLFTLLLPNVASFGLTMVAMALLFVGGGRRPVRDLKSP